MKMKWNEMIQIGWYKWVSGRENPYLNIQHVKYVQKEHDINIELIMYTIIFPMKIECIKGNFVVKMKSLCKTQGCHLKADKLKVYHLSALT